MKKTKLVSVILIMVISLSVLFITKNVYADNITGDLTGALSSGNSLTGSSKPENSISSSSTSGNSISSSSTSGNSVANNILRTNNTTSTYNNTSLPKTGVGDSMPVVILVVVLGISAVCAYKKMQDYRNI